jgi:hypothetical protein
MQNMNDDEKYACARKRVESLRAFYLHAASFVLVMAALAAWNVYAPQIWWVQWPLLGWGLGLASHGLSVYATGGEPLGRDWQERKIRELVARM